MSEQKYFGTKVYNYYGGIINDLKKVGINAVFFGNVIDREISLNEFRKFRDECKQNDILFFAIQEVFFNLKKDYKLRSANEKGIKETKDWHDFVCPSNEFYRQNRIEEIKNLAEFVKPDGISLDFIRYFVRWERTTPKNKLEDFTNHCFCDNCLEKFQKGYGIKIPLSFKGIEKKASFILKKYNNEWTSWKCDVIASMVKDVRKNVKDPNPNTLIVAHVLPWWNNDYNDAIRKIAGQDFTKLDDYVDIFSPMCYHWILQRKVSWINEITNYIYKKTSRGVLPSIQIESSNPMSGNITVDEFKESLEEAIKEPSSGINLWVWDKLIENPKKMHILTSFVNKYKEKNI